MTQEGGAFSPKKASTTPTRCYAMATCLALMAWFWCTAGGLAQERPATPQSESAVPPAEMRALSDFPWDTIEWVERRYKIEAIRFKCRDETGIDWWGSDEVMVSTTDTKGWTVSDEIGSIDSGKTHSFDAANSCIIGVRPGTVVLGKSSVCDDVGEAAPLSFGVEFWEKDWSPSDFCVIVGSPEPGRHGGPHCTHYGNDDFIGRARLDFAAWELEAALPSVGKEFVETVVLNPCSGGDVCDVTWGPDYSFTYRITRLRDVRVGLRGVLDEAMRRSGARSELEAIVNGLRSLHAPVPRKTEPEKPER
jgi:hypothetical protein